MDPSTFSYLPALSMKEQEEEKVLKAKEEDEELDWWVRMSTCVCLCLRLCLSVCLCLCACLCPSVSVFVSPPVPVFGRVWGSQREVLGRQLASAAGKGPSVSLSLLLEITNLEIEDELACGATCFWTQAL